MDILLLIGWLILGIILFGLVHNVLNITYFGFSGMFSVFFCCMAAVAIGFYFAASFIGWVITLVIGFFTAYYKWIIGGVVILVILGILGSKSDKGNDITEETKN